MKIEFYLNGEKKEVNAPSDQKTSYLLKTCGIKSIKEGCEIGVCSYCLILYRNRIVNSCNFPAFMIRGERIVTFEGVVGTPLYLHIVEILRRRGLQFCPLCHPARTLILKNYFDFGRVESDMASGILETCQCNCLSLSSMKKIADELVEWYSRDKSSNLSPFS